MNDPALSFRLLLIGARAARSNSVACSPVNGTTSAGPMRERGQDQRWPEYWLPFVRSLHSLGRSKIMHRTPEDQFVTSKTRNWL